MSSPIARKTRRFKIIFYLLLFTCILIMLTPFAVFDYMEIDMAIDWTVKRAGLTILFIVFVTSCWMYFKFIKHHETRNYQYKIWDIIRSIFRIITLTVGLTFIGGGTTFSSVTLLNAYWGNSNDVNINGHVVSFSQRTRKGFTHQEVVVYDDNLKRNIELETNTSFHVGDTFIDNMKMGSWGWLYQTKH